MPEILDPMRLSNRRRGRRVLALVSAVVALLCGLPAAPALAGASRPVVRTETGLLKGAEAERVDRFLAVPYAQPPVGELRWAAPRPALPWTGVRDAAAWGNRCAAAVSGNGPRSETEDCLYLNVFRPAGTRAGQRLPVLFWIHGGGLQNGSGNQHDGSLIARLENVVVVSINYRLGVFGFLAHPALTREAGQSGDYGLLDQQAALRWVQRNIGAFGGDPRQVTIDGESAGGFSVCAHLTAPGSKGLFGRAIIQSGSCISQPVSQAEQSGTSIATQLGCADDATAVACLRALTPARLVDGPQYSSFAHGGPVLPESPSEAVGAGRFQRVPLIVGSTRDEGRTFAQGNLGWTQAKYEGFVRSLYGDKADAVLRRYPWPAAPDQFTSAYLTAAILTDSGFIAGLGGCPTLTFIKDLSAYTRVFAYRFDHRTGPGLRPEPVGYEWGAGHAAELAYLWPSFDNGIPIAPTFDAAERRLAADMVHYWGSFTRLGRPQAPFASPWADYNRTSRVMSLRAGGRSVMVPVAEMATEHNCDLWNAL
ncbi:carboxylesterase/lipase family protein [Nonomuraea guangzhouensis]|uniref:Carboxylic ester hydrolase n=1 Tax=Nonomuraea guangzhouensis TaxID=1291555 RepID=A0ABW4FYM6_9ACTN|nr:carboxylesterase family protein [Nonomuraea guangzhouensis]